MSPVIVAKISVPRPQHFVGPEECRPILADQAMSVIDVARYLKASLCEVPDEYYRLRSKGPTFKEIILWFI